MKKRLIVLISLALISLTFTVSACTFGSSSQKEESLSYKRVGNYYVVDGIGSWDSSIVTVPSSYNGKPVKGISDNAFKDNKVITSVTISPDVSSIGKSAFDGCYNLTEVVFEENINLTDVGDKAFNGCRGLLNITVPEGVTAISDGMFKGCSRLANVIVPSTVRRIDSCAFENCSSLTQITFSAGSQLTKISHKAFSGCVDLPSVIVPSGVLLIDDYAFTGCSSLTNVIFSEGSQLQTFGKECFYGCTLLQTIKIPSNVTTIEEDVFGACNGLKNIEVDENNSHYKSIDGNLYCENGTVLLLYARGKSDTEFTFPNGVSGVKANAFNGSRLNDVNVSLGVTNIETGAFNNCVNLTNINVSQDNVTYKSVDGVLYSKNGTEIIKYPKGKNAVSFEIPLGVTTLCSRAFEECSYLENLIIPDSVAEVELGAVYKCDGLETLSLPFVGNARDCSITYFGHIFGGTNYWQNASCVPQGLTTVIITSVTKIGDYAFADCSNIEYIVLAETLKTIGARAFEGCNYGITTLERYTEYGLDAFETRGYLISVTIPDSVEKIGLGAFENAERIYKMTLPFVGSEKNIDLETYAFSADHFGHIFGGKNDEVVPRSLSEVEVTNAIAIWADAFADCIYLQKITIPSTVISIGDHAFYNCESLEEIVFADGIQLSVIEYEVFKNCYHLQTIVIPASVTHIWGGAFANTGLTTVTFADTEGWYHVTDINDWKNSVNGRQWSVTDVSGTIMFLGVYSVYWYKV